MQQRDIIKDQIEQVGKVLGKIIATYFDLKLTGDINDAYAITQKQLLDELDVDFVKLEKLNEASLLQYFESRNFSSSQLDKIANYLLDYAKHCANLNQENAIGRLKLAKKILDIAGIISETYSIERGQISNEIDTQISMLKAKKTR